MGAESERDRERRKIKNKQTTTATATEATTTKNINKTHMQLWKCKNSERNIEKRNENKKPTDEQQGKNQ